MRAGQGSSWDGRAHEGTACALALQRWPSLPSPPGSPAGVCTAPPPVTASWPASQRDAQARQGRGLLHRTTQHRVTINELAHVRKASGRDTHSHRPLKPIFNTHNDSMCRRRNHVGKVCAVFKIMTDSGEAERE